MVRTCLEAAAAAAEEGGRSRSSTCARCPRSTPRRSSPRSARPAAAWSCTRPPCLGGLGAEIAARVTEECFYHLEAPVLRVGGFSTPYPPSRLEEHYLPDLDRVLDAVDRSVRLLRGASVTGVQQFKLPDVGEGLTEAEIVKWHVQPGDQVTSTRSSWRSRPPRPWSSCPARSPGVVSALLVPEGETVDVGTPIISVETDAARPAGREPPTSGAPSGAARAAPRPRSRPVPRSPHRRSGRRGHGRGRGRRPVTRETALADDRSRLRPPRAAPAASRPASPYWSDTASRSAPPPAAPASRQPPPRRSRPPPLPRQPASDRVPGLTGAAPPSPPCPRPRGRTTVRGAVHEPAAGSRCWPSHRYASWPGTSASTWPALAGTGPDGSITRDDVRAAADRSRPAGSAGR